MIVLLEFLREQIGQVGSSFEMRADSRGYILEIFLQVATGALLQWNALGLL